MVKGFGGTQKSNSTGMVEQSRDEQQQETRAILRTKRDSGKMCCCQRLDEGTVWQELNHKRGSGAKAGTVGPTSNWLDMDPQRRWRKLWGAIPGFSPPPTLLASAIVSLTSGTYQEIRAKELGHVAPCHTERTEKGRDLIWEQIDKWEAQTILKTLIFFIPENRC